MKTFAVLQLSGCAGCEMSLLEAEDWTQQYKLTHLPLVISSHDIPDVEVLLISGGVRTDEDLFNLRRSVKKAKQVVAVGTCAISGGVASLGDREEAYDPRSYLTMAETAMAERVKLAVTELKGVGTTMYKA